MHSNYHTHSCYCDGAGELETYIKKAKEFNMKALGMSSHAPLPFESWWNMPEEYLPTYLEELKILKQKYNSQDFKLLSSLEIDFIPGIMGVKNPKIIAANLDYTVGSVHYVNMLESGIRWTIDGDDETFEKGISEIFNGDVMAAINQYFLIQMEMIDKEPPDILGHCDKIRMHNANKYFFDENENSYKSKVYDLMKFAAEKGVIVEINTKYLAPAGLLFPAKEHFKWMYKNKIPVTISSDAHHPNKLLDGFSEVTQMLQAAGYKEVSEL
jgi:histidinol-phosphatase (PHP family)